MLADPNSASTKIAVLGRKRRAVDGDLVSEEKTKKVALTAAAPVLPPPPPAAAVASHAPSPRLAVGTISGRGVAVGNGSGSSSNGKNPVMDKVMNDFSS